MRLERDLAGSVLMNTCREANSARFCERLQSGCDVHAVAQEITPFDDHVALMHANPHLDAMILGMVGVSFAYPLLDTDCCPQSLDRARELGEQPIPQSA